MKKVMSLAAVAVLLVSSLALPVAQAQTVSSSACSIDFKTATHDQLTSCLIMLEGQLIVLLTELQAQTTAPVAQVPAVVAPSTTTPNNPTVTPAAPTVSTPPITVTPQTQPVLPPQTPATVAAPQVTMITVTQNPATPSFNVLKFDAGDIVASFILTNTSTQNVYVNELQVMSNVPFLQNVRPMVGSSQNGSVWANPQSGTRQVMGGNIYVAANSSVQLDFASDFNHAVTGSYGSVLSLCGASATNGKVQDSNGNVLNPYGMCETSVAGQNVTVQ